jgi:hypothetical protein
MFTLCIREVAVHLQKALEVISTSVDTGLNQIYVPSLSAQRLSERTVFTANSNDLRILPHASFRSLHTFLTVNTDNFPHRRLAT